MLGKGNYEYALPFYGDRRPILIDLALHPNPEMEKKYTAIQRQGDKVFGEAFTPNLPPGNVHLSATASVLRDSRGEIYAAIECIRDNTYRRQAEEALQKSEEKFRYITESPEFERLKAYHPYVIIETDVEKDLLHIKGSPVHLEKTLRNRPRINRCLGDSQGP